MKKRKILIIIPSFGIGGITVSLQSLLSVIDPNKVSVDVFACSRQGAFIDKMPNCRILKENVWLSSDIIDSGICKKIIVRLIWVLSRILFHLGIDIYPLKGLIGGKAIKSQEYDAVIGYSEIFAKFIADLPARKRILWIHCDYNRYLALSKIKNEKRAFKKLDKVVAVSKYVEKQLCDLYPEYKEKFTHIHNIINIEAIRERALEQTQLDKYFDTNTFVVVSAGRLDPVKQFDAIPRIANEVRKMTKSSFKWYIIGGGCEDVANLIDEEIKSNEVGDVVFRLSAKNNIYPYMAQASLYVCTSTSESFPLVVNEAKALCIPVVSNDFPSVHESVKDGVDGYVVTLDNMPETIAKIIDSPMRIGECSIDNEGRLKSFYNLL